jgi:DNA-directed RNA polymerase specialized sigma24 family protein
MMQPLARTVEGTALPAPTIEDLDRHFAAGRAGLVRLCSSFVGVDEADDVVQDAYVVARQRLWQLQDPNALGAWLKRIAVNRCYDRHRRAKRLDQRLPLLARAETVGGRDPGLRELVEQLPPRQRTVLVLHYAYGYSLVEIAELLSLSHVNVRTIIARTRRSLLEAWMETR